MSTRQPAHSGKVRFQVRQEVLYLRLPSGRELAYRDPQINVNRWGGPQLTFMGASTDYRWSRLETYGGKRAENVTQAIARDILSGALKWLAAAGFEAIFHVHDEVVMAVPAQDSTGTRAAEIHKILTETPAWAQGLPLDAEGFETQLYKKG